MVVCLLGLDIVGLYLSLVYVVACIENFFVDATWCRLMEGLCFALVLEFWRLWILSEVSDLGLKSGSQDTQALRVFGGLGGREFRGVHDQGALRKSSGFRVG